MEKKKFLIILVTLLVVALLVRLIYVIKTPYMEKQHDVEPNGNGLSYIFELYEKGTLPQDNEDQHYHPPLHPILSAIWLKAISNFTTDKTLLCESLQFLTVIYSMILILVVYEIVKELKMNKKLQILVLFVMAFHPTLIILSGSINNDNLCLLLMIWSLLRLVKWYQKANIKNIIILAIMTGLCVMTKMAGAIIAIPIIYVFLFKFYKEIKKSSNKTEVVKTYMFMFLVFGCISLPIGLWYAIRNYFLFHQPILYVKDPQNERLYVGNYSLLERFSPISSEIMTMYANPWENYNIPVFLLKCSLFGEYTWAQDYVFQILYDIAILGNCFLIMVTIISMIKSIKIKNKRNKIWVISLFLLFAFNLFSYIIMNLKLPYGCSMDFRYIASTVFSGVMLVCFNLDYTRGDKKKLFNMVYRDILTLTFILFFASDIIILGS